MTISPEMQEKFSKWLDKQRAKKPKRSSKELKVNPQILADEIMRDYRFYTYPDTKDVLVYSEGFYQPKGQVWIEREVKERLKDNHTSHINVEVLKAVKFSTYKGRSHFNRDLNLLNLENGILNLKGSSLSPHSPDILSTVRLPIVYDPEADCPAIRKFISEIVAPKDIPLMEEIVGYCLDPYPKIQKVFLLVGGGSNGKSTFLSLLKAFLGPTNCSHVDLQTLEGDKFSSSELYGKLANLQADIPSITIRDTSHLKTLTGGDTILGQKKFRDAFSFVNTAKLVFSANKPPKVIDETEAFWGRWIVIDFPNQFKGGKEDWYLLDKLTTKSELSGLLNLALEALVRLRESRKFSYTKSIDAVKERYQILSDPVYHLVRTCCEYESDSWIPKIDLYQLYQVFAERVNAPIMTKKSFGLSLMRVCGDKVRNETRTVEGETKAGWKGLKAMPIVSMEE